MDASEARLCWGKGLLALRSKRWAAAIECFNAVIKWSGGPASGNPKLANAYSNISIALRRLDIQSEALTAIDQALRLNPKDADLWLNKANCLVEMESWNEALKFCQQAVHLNPDLGKAWLKLAGIWVQGFRDFEKTLECARRALALCIIEAQPLVNSCEGYLELAQPSQITEENDKLVEAIGLAELANDRRLEHQFDEAERLLRRR